MSTEEPPPEIDVSGIEDALRYLGRQTHGILAEIVEHGLDEPGGTTGLVLAPLTRPLECSRRMDDQGARPGPLGADRGRGQGPQRRPHTALSKAPCLGRRIAPADRRNTDRFVGRIPHLSVQATQGVPCDIQRSEHDSADGGRVERRREGIGGVPGAADSPCSGRSRTGNPIALTTNRHPTWASGSSSTTTGRPGRTRYSVAPPILPRKCLPN